MKPAIHEYAQDVSRLLESTSTTERTYYPQLRDLVEAALAERHLPFEVRIETSQSREDQSDQPDLALYDSEGEFLVVCGEVKLPTVEISDMARSTERNNQVGRYLQQTDVVLLCNLRSFGLLTTEPDCEVDGPVPPEERRLEHKVDLFEAPEELGDPSKVLEKNASQFLDLVETAVTRFAPISQPESLARILARHARRAREDLPFFLSNAVEDLLNDYGEALGLSFDDDRGETFLRSTIVQTAFYGVFAGWTLWHYSDSEESFDWKDLHEYLDIPFLGKLFHEFQHPDRLDELNLEPHLDRATETLSRVNRDEFFSRFQRPSLEFEEASVDLESDSITAAITYFYEPFLKAYDPDLRKEMGVWYTPPKIVRYQVERVHELLKNELDCRGGLANERVVVLDPACGTGAYLLEVLRLIGEELQEEGIGDLMGERLLQAASDRVIGFEILTAPFVVAHLQLHLLFSDLDVDLQDNERPAVFLTNALTGWSEEEQPTLSFPELQEEYDEARSVKEDSEIIVVLGNPPYNRFYGRALEGERWLVDHYKGIERDADGDKIGNTQLYEDWGIQKHLLDDLYIRFLRLSEVCVGEQQGFGVVSFISNRSFYTGRSHPIMRESLLSNFSKIWADDLNGDKYETGKIIPEGYPGEGGSDQSVFSTESDPTGIQVGVGITTMLTQQDNSADPENCDVYYRNFWGTASAKRQALTDSLKVEGWSEEQKESAANSPPGPRPYDAIEPSEERRWNLAPHSNTNGYTEWPAIEELCPVSFQGINPNRGIDGSVIAMDREELKTRMRHYFSDMNFEELETRYPELCEDRARYDPKEVRGQLRRISEFRDDHIVPYVIFPLDCRYIYYASEAKLLNERRPELWNNLPDNEFLITVPEKRQESESLPMVVDTLFDLHLHDRGAVGFPVKVEETRQTDLFGDNEESANLNPEAWNKLREYWDLSGDLTGADAVEVVQLLFDIALAVCHSPTYQEEHRDSLEQDWAHIPIPRNYDHAAEIAEIGKKISKLLNPRASADEVIQNILGNDASTLAVVTETESPNGNSRDLVVSENYFGAGTGRWEEREANTDEAYWSKNSQITGDLFINDDVYFRHVPKCVWEYRIGGYPILAKWLGYREADKRGGAPLTIDEAETFRGIVKRVSAVCALHDSLNEQYDAVVGDCFTAEELGMRT